MISRTLEAEFITQDTVQALPVILPKREDLGDGRVADMDAGHITMQVLS